MDDISDDELFLDVVDMVVLGALAAVGDDPGPAPVFLSGRCLFMADSALPGVSAIPPPLETP
jgi:hypothetical protein